MEPLTLCVEAAMRSVPTSVLHAERTQSVGTRSSVAPAVAAAFQGCAAVGKQAEIDQFLFDFIESRIVQRMHDLVEEQVCKFLTGAVQRLASGVNREGLAEPCAELLCQPGG